MTTKKESRARSVADLAQGSILATVEIAAPPERVFRALASKEIVEWWGAEGVYRTTEWEGDVRGGGRWRSTGVGADGKPFSVQGEYVEIDSPRRLTHTWQPDWDPGSTTRVTYQLEAIEGGTLLTLRHVGFTSRDSCKGHVNGWGMVLAWLAGHVAPRRAPPSHYLIRLIPPRPTFLQDMTEQERSIMGEHVGYWTRLLADGVAVAFGPVADPQGPWGVGLVEVDGAEALAAIESGDPAMRAGAGFRYEVLPMLRAIVRPR
jgi:uncharacterized protein YndB with AHSA1/START domain